MTIDHIVPLSHIHEVGAWDWADQSRQQAASDIGYLAAYEVVGQAVNSAKANSGPDVWRPLRQESWCRYAVAWVGFKHRWGLPLASEAERQALTEMLDTCAQPKHRRPASLKGSTRPRHYSHRVSAR